MPRAQPRSGSAVVRPVAPRTFSPMVGRRDSRHSTASSLHPNRAASTSAGEAVAEELRVELHEKDAMLMRLLKENFELKETLKEKEHQHDTKHREEIVESVIFLRTPGEVLPTPRAAGGEARSICSDSSQAILQRLAEFETVADELAKASETPPG
eukprot:Hpha_TRINITY_DN31590_c0_g1::TRINITY_DN31590_c0_g1_i1::g.1685::m.1685